MQISLTSNRIGNSRVIAHFRLKATEHSEWLRLGQRIAI